VHRVHACLGERKPDPTPPRPAPSYSTGSQRERAGAGVATWRRPRPRFNQPVWYTPCLCSQPRLVPLLYVVSAVAAARDPPLAGQAPSVGWEVWGGGWWVWV